MSATQTQDRIPVAISLGSNMGARALVLRTAIQEMAPYLAVTAVSPVYETPAAYVTAQPAFLNAAVLGTTTLSPLALLWSLKYLERQMGRQPTYRYGPRLIDLDLLFYGDQSVREAELCVPHPRLPEREFVLRPLADIAPGWKNPQTGLTVAEMLAQLGESTAVRTDETL